MRIAVLADIHGNLPALEAVLADARAQGVNAIATAGDMTSGVWSEEVVKLVLEVARWSIAGNHEDYYGAYDRGAAPAPWGGGRQWAALRWCYGCLSRSTLDALATLPVQAVITLEGTDPIRLLHGSPRDVAGRLYPDMDAIALAHFRRAGTLTSAEVPPLAQPLAEVTEPVVMCGHTHIPWVQQAGTRMAANPGAVGGALNGDWRAQYAILTWAGTPAAWHTEHRAVAYDLDRVRQGFADSGYLEEGGAFARAILQSIETGLNWPGALLRHIYAYARGTGWDDTACLPDGLWDEGVATFEWGSRSGLSHLKQGSQVEVE